MVKYPLSMRILHWLLALLILGMLAVGLLMTGLSHGNPYRGLLFSLHKSFGMTILALALLRIGMRLKGPLPALPPQIPAFERLLAHCGHLALYGFMLLLPVSGYLMSTYYGLPVSWFGLALPHLVGVNRADGALASDLHAYGAYTLIALLAIHVGAVALHYGKHRVNLLKRML